MDLRPRIYGKAIQRLEKALDRYPDDGLSWYFLARSHLRQDDLNEALRCGYRAVRCSGTVSLGYDLAGRAAMRRKDYAAAVELFRKSTTAYGTNMRAKEHIRLIRRMRTARNGWETNPRPKNPMDSTGGREILKSPSGFRTAS